MDYKKAGVNRGALSNLKLTMAKKAAMTHNNEVIAKIGHFGSAYRLADGNILVQSIDGVGTMLMVAKAANSLSICGESLVNHCVNDILCCGAKPITFLDYIAFESFRDFEVESIFDGMVSACRNHGIALVGGETAQMPSLYKAGDYELVGCIAGIVEQEKFIDGSKIKPGDVLLGLPSFGLHTNGWSLVRKAVFEKAGWSPYYYCKELGGQLGRILLQPHKSYFKLVYPILDSVDWGSIHGIAHITGGGLKENIIRILPKGCQVRIRMRGWPILPVFQWIQKIGKIPMEEMLKVFNMGIGMVLVVPKDNADLVAARLRESGETLYLIGEIEAGRRGLAFYKKEACDWFA